MTDRILMDDVYDTMEDGVSQRRYNKERLALLESQSAERQLRMNQVLEYQATTDPDS
jgi:hypothetical protein